MIYPGIEIELATLEHFDAAGYLHANADVAASICVPGDARLHFELH